MDFPQKPVEGEDVPNFCCGSNVKFITTIVFGGGDYVPVLEVVGSPTFTLIRAFVDYSFGSRWSQWNAVE